VHARVQPQDTAAGRRIVEQSRRRRGDLQRDRPHGGNQRVGAGACLVGPARPRRTPPRRGRALRRRATACPGRPGRSCARA